MSYPPFLTDLSQTPPAMVPKNAVRIDGNSAWSNPHAKEADAANQYRDLLWQRILDGALTVDDLADLHGAVFSAKNLDEAKHARILYSASVWAAAERENRAEAPRLPGSAHDEIALVYHADSIAGFRYTHEKNGVYSNFFTETPIHDINGLDFDNSEVLYQAARYPHKPERQAEIVGARTAKEAKSVANRDYMESRDDWLNVRPIIMLYVIGAKLARHWGLICGELATTGQRHIVEISTRDSYWGAKPQRNGTYVGENILGRLWMHYRQQIADGELRKGDLLDVPGGLDDFLFNGRPPPDIRFGETNPERAARPARRTRPGNRA